MFKLRTSNGCFHYKLKKVFLKMKNENNTKIQSKNHNVFFSKGKNHNVNC